MCFRNQHLIALITASTLLLTTSCRKDKEPVKPATDINGTVDAAGTPTLPPANSIRYRDTAVEQILVNGSPVPCTTYMVDRVQRINTFDYFYTEDKADLWPGNVVQGKYLKEQARLISLGAFPRDRMNFTFQGSQGSGSVSLDHPDNSSYQAAFSKKSPYFWFMPPLYSYQNTQISYTTEQGLLDLGLNLNFLAGGLGTRFQYINTNGLTTLYLFVKNVYFNVSAQYPTNPAGFFGAEVNVSDLKRVVSGDNPPAYVSSVSYGRIALVRAVSAYSQREVKTSIDLFLNGLGASMTATQRKIASELQLTVEAAPGPAYTIKTLDDLNQFINDGAQFNHRTGCVPVSYEARYLSDNSPLITHTGI
ncbi:MAG: thiol-activated cytolysin family protein, partial [Bacteroidetes bacterium]|nr:thiol-activated cytolysin family protein [Bacteroidota bacterium]